MFTGWMTVRGTRLGMGHLCPWLESGLVVLPVTVRSCFRASGSGPLCSPYTTAAPKIDLSYPRLRPS